MERPTHCIRAEMPTTSNNEAAVNISGVLDRAIQRNTGRSSSRPARTMPMITPMMVPASRASSGHFTPSAA